MAKKMSEERIEIKAPNLKVSSWKIRGDAPFVQHKFSEKTRRMMREKQEAGSTAKKGQKREPKDFQAICEGATYRGPKGECGIPASAFRCAMISACRMAGFQMTRAKLSVFVLADFFDAGDHTPLVSFTKGKPEYSESPVRLATGVVDISPRPMWAPGWEMIVRVRYDADQFTATDVGNLVMRAGMQVGVGEGRPDSKKSCGCGWGTFVVVPGKGK